MYLLLRILGVWLLLLAMVAAVIDATKTLAGGGQWVVSVTTRTGPLAKASSALLK